MMPFGGSDIDILYYRMSMGSDEDGEKDQKKCPKKGSFRNQGLRQTWGPTKRSISLVIEFLWLWIAIYCYLIQKILDLWTCNMKFI